MDDKDKLEKLENEIQELKIKLDIAIKLLEKSATPFDEACMILREVINANKTL